MPHRTTYFFPRQFPDRGFFPSSKELPDHHDRVEKESFDGESNRKGLEIYRKKTSVPDHRSTGDKIHGKQLAAFVNWLTEKKSERRSAHVNGDDRELLLQPENSEPETDLSPAPLRSFPSESNYGGKLHGFDRQTSLQRQSSCSSYAGSDLFSGTTLDCTFSSTIRGSQLSKTTEEKGGSNRDSFADRSRESYCLQLTLARRLTDQASLATEPLLLGYGGEIVGLGASSPPDAETVSYRLWVQSLSP